MIWSLVDNSSQWQVFLIGNDEHWPTCAIVNCVLSIAMVDKTATETAAATTAATATAIVYHWQ